jgi:hypothetical protein
MLRLICGSALAGLLAVAPASSQSVPAPDRQLRVGKYHFEEEGIAVDVSLNADSTAVYSVGGTVGIRAEGTGTCAATGSTFSTILDRSSWSRRVSPRVIQASPASRCPVNGRFARRRPCGDVAQRRWAVLYE